MCRQALEVRTHLIFYKFSKQNVAAFQHGVVESTVTVSKAFSPAFTLIPIKVAKRENEQFAKDERKKAEDEAEACHIRLVVTAFRKNGLLTISFSGTVTTRSRNSSIECGI